jgi:hypothetical protein
MPDVGFVDLKITFPSPVTERGVVVNTIDLKVLNAFGVEVDTFTLADLERVETVLEGIYYVLRNYDVSDPNKTPETYITLNYQGTIGNTPTGLKVQRISFQPSIGDPTSGVLLQWEPPEVVEKGRNMVDPLFYEVRRVDERYAISDREQTQFEPETWTTAFWPFDDDYDDDAPDPADLVATGVVTHVNGGGIIGSAPRFSGNGYLSTPDPAKLAYGPGQDFSLHAWVMVSPEFPAALVAGRIGNIASQGYGLYIDRVGGTEFRPLVVINGGVGNKVAFQSPTNLYDGLWHQIIVTFDRDGNATIYIDGVEDSVFDISITANVDFSSVPQDFSVGGNVNGLNYFGMIDEVIAFNRVLTWIDVEKLYNDQYGIPAEQVLGRTNFTQFVDTDFSDAHQMRHYRWIVYRAQHVQAEQPHGADYKMVLYKTIVVQDVDYVDAPMCFVEGRVRLPTDQYPQAAIAKFFVAPWDRGQVVHDRILARDQWWSDINRNGKFGAYLIQDAVVVLHIPAAHIQWRFCVPRQERVTIQDLLAQGKIEKQKFRINV